MKKEILIPQEMLAIYFVARTYGGSLILLLEIISVRSFSGFRFFRGCLKTPLEINLAPPDPQADHPPHRVRWRGAPKTTFSGALLLSRTRDGEGDFAEIGWGEKSIGFETAPYSTSTPLESGGKRFLK